MSSNTLRRVGKEAERRSWQKLDTKDEVKIVERAGTKLRFLLHKSNPFDGGKIKCNRDKCLICDNPLNKKFNCGQRNVTYITVCLKCEEDSKKPANREQDDNPEADNDVESEESAVAERPVISKRYYGESHRSGGGTSSRTCLRLS